MDEVITPDEIPMAPSKQLESPQITPDGKRQQVRFFTAHQSMLAVLKASDVLLDRRHLENRSHEKLQQGDVGSIWLKLVVDVDSQAPEEWLNARGTVAPSPRAGHFLTPLSSPSKYRDKLKPGLRVLSVDLGIRTFASCSVFELVAGKPAKGTCFPADQERKLWAQHERSFLLSLPGEGVSSKVRDARYAANKELRELRSSVWNLKSLLRFTAKEDAQERRDAIKDLLETLREADEDSVSVSMTTKITDLLLVAASSPEDWSSQVRSVYQVMERWLSEIISQWRRRTRLRRPWFPPN